MSKEGKRKKWLTIYLNEELKNRLQEVADHYGFPRNQVANILLSTALDYWEKGLLELKLKPKKKR